MILNRNRGYYRPGSVSVKFIRNPFSLARCSGFNIYNNISSVISICSFSAQGIKISLLATWGNKLGQEVYRKRSRREPERYVEKHARKKM